MPSKLEQKHDLEASQAYRRAWAALERLTQILEDEMGDGMFVREIRIQGPNVTGGGFRAIVKGEADGRKFVSFHNGEAMGDLLAGLKERLTNGTINWKDDLPWKPPTP